MQFPVPQFTDVEDKIIGPFTIKQFGIIFGAGVIIFLGYSGTKSLLVLIFLCILFGVPALALAFGKLNGRPLYNTIGYFFKFLSSNKILIFHKEVQTVSQTAKLKDVDLETNNKDTGKAVTQPHTPNLKEIQKILADTQEKEKQVISKM